MLRWYWTTSPSWMGSRDWTVMAVTTPPRRSAATATAMTRSHPRRKLRGFGEGLLYWSSGDVPDSGVMIHPSVEQRSRGGRRRLRWLSSIAEAAGRRSPFDAPQATWAKLAWQRLAWTRGLGP